jgi:hypothetical protein
MTASISRNAFLYGATESISEIVFPVALTAARYAVLASDLATSDEARQTYRWVKDMGIALGQLAFWSVVWAYNKVQQWAEAEVQSCLHAEIDHIADAGEMVEADPFAPTENQHYPAMAATIAAPVATLVVPTTPEYQGMTTGQLRKECQARGIKWRNAHGTKHLSKGEMIDALS